jgi:cob(I)alamin adenosyltransferase
VAVAAIPPGVTTDRITSIQSELFAVGAELATVPGHESRLSTPLVSATEVGRLEAWIDEVELGLPALQNFIVPGGCPGGAALHAARTICRRAERRVIAAGREGPVRRELVVYLNRLSDLLFVLARSVNHHAGAPETTWNPRGATHAQGR